MLEAAREALREVRATPWRPLGTPAAAGLAVAFVLVAWFELTRRPPWVPLLDPVNLMFHEAGHPIFGLLPGETIGVLGGTLMQLAVPLLVAGRFWTGRQTAGFAFATFWLAQNLHNIATYVGDARAQELPLLGGGDHDWGTLLGDWGWLSRDADLARTIHAIGWLGMLGATVWMAWRWSRRERA